MDRRSWPWKKKSSEKTVVATNSSSASLANSAENQGEQDNPKSANYVTISVETYTHMTELEDQVKSLEDQVTTLNEKLSSALSDITTKDNLVKQHSKVAEEAVSGWEKAEAEALALKNSLESVTLLKLTAEDRASHLDGALKECMRQIRNVKEESEQKLHDVVFAKTKQWDKVKLELESKIVDLDQELLRASAENSALSRSLQERSSMLVNITEEKSQANAEIEVLRTNIQSCEREINSLKYELHISAKELEIRNEERNMSLRSAEVANKQHLESVKKITKLEAECQRLRGLVRKKLPGPAALAQMKLEVESLGRDCGETRPRRSPVKNPSQHMAPATEFSLDNIQQFHKETEFLTARLLTMEEEMKLLKEALSKRNSELQASRNMCAKTASRLRTVEAQMLAMNQQKSPMNLNADITTEGSLSHNASNPPSLTSMSEDGVDDAGSCADSWATPLISEFSHIKKEKNVDKGNKTENSSNLELMDDFLEMEKLATLSTESNGTVSNNIAEVRAETAEPNGLVDVAKVGDLKAIIQPDLDISNKKSSSMDTESDTDRVTLTKLQARISLAFDSQAKDSDVVKVLEDIKRIVQDIQDAMPQHSVKCIFEETRSADLSCKERPGPEDIAETTDSGMSLVGDNKLCIGTKNPIVQDLANAISEIHDFVLSLGKEAIEMQDKFPDEHGLSTKIEEFSASVNKVLSCKMSLDDFILDLSHILAEASELSFNMMSDKGNEGESNSSDCIDKVTLLENKVVKHDRAKERFSSECALVSQSNSDPEVLQDGSVAPSFEPQASLCKCLQEDFERLALEKDKIAVDLARCTESLEEKRLQLLETEQLIAETKSQLASSQKSNSLSETQLKCMAESYKSLETHAQELETEINLLHAKVETLDIELQEEKCSHKEALSKCKDLEEQIQRNEGCPMCSLSSNADDDKKKQEREIAAAAEKLAECQETIFLLSRQLKAMRPSPTDTTGSPYNERHRPNEDLMINEPSPSQVTPESIHDQQDLDQTEMEAIGSNMNRTGSESPLDTYNAHLSQSDPEASPVSTPNSSKRPKHRPTRSSSSSSSSIPTPEKQARGFSRFFSRGKSIPQGSAH